MSLGLLEILAMLLPVLALGGLLGRLSQKAKLKELDDKAFRNHTALQEAEARRRGAESTSGVADAELIRRVATTGSARAKTKPE